MSKLISNKREHHENHLEENTPKWFAVYTHYKREKITAKQLSQTGIEVYLPIQTLTRTYVRKTKVVELPLINNYVFVKITKKEYVRVLQCPYVLNFIKFANNLISIPEQEIDLLKRILGETTAVEIDNVVFQKGDQVEVIGGNLTGFNRYPSQKRKQPVLKCTTNKYRLISKREHCASFIEKSKIRYIGLIASYSHGN